MAYHARPRHRRTSFPRPGAEEADLDEDVDAGDSVTIDLGGVEAGTYDFLCEYHPDQMTGTLEVTE